MSIKANIKTFTNLLKHCVILKLGIIVYENILKKIRG